MANPTTNYGFVLPDPTSLVTDLPADFDIALQGVDTQLKALQPGTTSGDLIYASATANTNLRLGIGTTDQLLAVVAGVPAWASAATLYNGQAYTPTFTNLTVGNATFGGRSLQIGKLGYFSFNFVFGSTTVMTAANPTFTLPFTSKSNVVFYNANILDTGVVNFGAFAEVNANSAICTWRVQNVSGTFPTTQGCTPTNPMTWATGDSYQVSGSYEVA